MDINTELQSIQEIKAIREMKNNEAPRVVDISTELLKAVEFLMPTILLKIFHEIWIFKNMPEDSKTALIEKLVKDLSDFSNWRGITLLSPTSKEEQRGTCKGNSCSDHILTLRQILEQV